MAYTTFESVYGTIFDSYQEKEMFVIEQFLQRALSRNTSETEEKTKVRVEEAKLFKYEELSEQMQEIAYNKFINSKEARSVDRTLDRSAVVREARELLKSMKYPSRDLESDFTTNEPSMATYGGISPKDLISIIKRTSGEKVAKYFAMIQVSQNHSLDAYFSRRSHNSSVEHQASNVKFTLDIEGYRPDKHPLIATMKANIVKEVKKEMKQVYEKVNEIAISKYKEEIEKVRKDHLKTVHFNEHGDIVDKKTISSSFVIKKFL